MNWHDFGERRNGFFLLRYPLLEPHLLLSKHVFTFLFYNLFWQHLLGKALDRGVHKLGAMLDGVPKGRNIPGMVTQGKEHSGHDSGWTFGGRGAEPGA